MIELQEKNAELSLQLTLKNFELEAALSANQELIKDKAKLKQMILSLTKTLSKTELDLADAIKEITEDESWLI